MKKTFKTIFAAVLAFTLLFCAFIPAFAFEENDTVGWCFCSYEYVDPYTYAGELSEGEHELILSDTYNLFKAGFEKSGFYLLTFDQELVNSILVSKTVHNGLPCSEANVLLSEKGGKAIVYIPDEETYIGIWTVSDLTVADIKISYYGYEIEDIVFENGLFENVIYGEDFRIFADENRISFWGCAEVLFENGEKYFTDYSWMDFSVDGDVAHGGNNIVFSLGDYSEEITMTVCYASDYIRKIEITNLDNYLHSVRYYDGTLESDFEYGALESEGVAITFWDGTNEVIEELDGYDMVQLPNGRYYEMNVMEIDNGDSVEFAFSIAGQILLSRKCELENAGLSQNVELLEKNIHRQTKWIVYEIREFVDALGNPGHKLTASEIAGWISSIGKTVETRMRYVKEEITEFCGYYGF